MRTPTGTWSTAYTTPPASAPAPSTMSTVLGGLAPDTEYLIRVRAYSAGNVSAFSNVFVGTTTP